MMTVCVVKTSNSPVALNSPLCKKGTVPLMVIADGGLSTSQLVALQTLSGALARTVPQIYRQGCESTAHKLRKTISVSPPSSFTLPYLGSVATSPTDPTDSYALWLRDMQTNHAVGRH
jgi:hypothetical protein